MGEDLSIVERRRERAEAWWGEGWVWVWVVRWWRGVRGGWRRWRRGVKGRVRGVDRRRWSWKWRVMVEVGALLDELARAMEG